jgi:hypothetical protein
VRREGDVTVLTAPNRYDIVYPALAETYVARVLDRDPSRAHCDLHQTQSRILQNL